MVMTLVDEIGITSQNTSIVRKDKIGLKLKLIISSVLLLVSEC